MEGERGEEACNLHDDNALCVANLKHLAVGDNLTRKRKCEGACRGKRRSLERKTQPSPTSGSGSGSGSDNGSDNGSDSGGSSQSGGGAQDVSGVTSGVSACCSLRGGIVSGARVMAASGRHVGFIGVVTDICGNMVTVELPQPARLKQLRVSIKQLEMTAHVPTKAARSSAIATGEVVTRHSRKRLWEYAPASTVRDSSDEAPGAAEGITARSLRRLASPLADCPRFFAGGCGGVAHGVASENGDPFEEGASCFGAVAGAHGSVVSPLDPRPESFGDCSGGLGFDGGFTDTYRRHGSTSSSGSSSGSSCSSGFSESEGGERQSGHLGSPGYGYEHRRRPRRKSSDRSGNVWFEQRPCLARSIAPQGSVTQDTVRCVTPPLGPSPVGDVPPAEAVLEPAVATGYTATGRLWQRPRPVGLTLGVGEVDTEVCPAGGLSKATKVLDNLWLSGQEVTADRASLQREGVTHIVNCSLRLANFYPDDFCYHRVSWADASGQDMRPDVLEAAFRHIDAARLSGGACLVHCQAGMSRSCSLVMAYLMQLGEGMSLAAALEFCQMRRPQCNPDVDFLLKLSQYEELLFGQTSVCLDHYHRGDAASSIVLGKNRGMLLAVGAPPDTA